MTRRLFIECGAAETRAALVDGDEAVKFWFAPARGDEAAAIAVEEGDIRLARVRSCSTPLGGAFVDIGEEADAFLPTAKNQSPPVEGAKTIVRVKRSALGRKGAVVDLDWRRGLSPGAQQAAEACAANASTPCALLPPADPAMKLARIGAAFKPAEIVADDSVALTALGNLTPVVVDETAVIEADIQGAIEESLSRHVGFSGGGRLTIDETEALVAVDVDLAGRADASQRHANDLANKAAVARLFRELSKRGIGGRIVVDFPPPTSPAARRDLLEGLTALDADIFPRRIGKLAPDGLLDLTAPRREKSLLERATEPAGEGWARAGRRLTIDWQAKAAIGALERALRRSRARRLTLLASEDLAAYLTGRETWLGRLRERYGARFTIETRPQMKERSFDVAG